mmetsp:Transcript_64777/g.189991  ORF Transcript_64777/g.189991 Transcript_64777/m.189991 type:complete len:766 (-) Transcript_64777:37-2334(-)
MLNWGDKDAAELLAVQLQELLRDRTMTYDQLASIYSIKQGHSVTQRLKEMSRDRRPMALGDFIAQMTDYFEMPGKNQVKAIPGAVRPAAAAAPAAVAPPVPSGYAGAAGGPSPPTAAGAAQPPPGPAVAKADEHEDEAPMVTMKYADVSRGVQNILKEANGRIQVDHLDAQFRQKFGTDISDVVGMSTGEYLQRKENIFDYRPSENTVALHSVILTGPPPADSGATKDETFVVKEFESLIETMGPVVYISTLCGKFIQRNGISVTSVISTRPLDLFKRHPGIFLIVGAGNVTLKKFEHMPDVQRLLDKPSSKAQRIAKAAEAAQLPVPEVVTERHVVEEFQRLILVDGTDSVYISSLCGRFLQRFKKPVTQIIDVKPAEFLRRYPDIFVMTGGGNVGLREVLGPDAVSVPPPPPRVPKALREEQIMASEHIQAIVLSDKIFTDIHSSLQEETTFPGVVQQLLNVCRQMEQTSFLALEEVVLGGPSGKGLLSEGPVAEIVLFVRQLPFRNFAQWLPHILDTLSPVLEAQLAGEKAEKFKVEKDHLHFHMKGTEAGKDLTVCVYLSPLFKSRDHLLECIKTSPPAERFYFSPAMVKERSDTIGRQPPRVKVLIRLMTWWASKQHWSSALSAPGDWLMELITLHVCKQLEKAGGDLDQFDLDEWASKVLEACAGFETLKVTWAETGLAVYSQEDIWRPLLSHEPLLLDPLNPYCNLADANSFDARELAAAAAPPGCLNVFKRQAAAINPSSGDDEEYEDYEDEHYEDT